MDGGLSYSWGKHPVGGLSYNGSHTVGETSISLRVQWMEVSHHVASKGGFSGLPLRELPHGFFQRAADFVGTVKYVTTRRL